MKKVLHQEQFREISTLVSNYIQEMELRSANSKIPYEYFITRDPTRKIFFVPEIVEIIHEYPNDIRLDKSSMDPIR